MARRTTPRRPRRSDEAARLSIRMYNVGFGDCFLLRIPTDNGFRKVVIDCGSIKGKNKTIQEISDALIEDCRDGDGKVRIDVLIMSHRHRDHISGFVNPAWADVEVGEVWMPWLESRTDRSARIVRERQARAAATLALAVQRLGLDAELADVALNASPNDEALDVLHSGFALKVKPRFFPSGTSVVERVDTDALPGVEVFVLGPPHDHGALNDPDPPSEQILLTGFLELDRASPALEKFRPLGEDWVEQWPESLFDKAEIDEAVSQVGLYELMAAKLDAEINNTSLILVFRVGNDYLLFPGDAQWGPWELVLADEEAIDLLKKVTFLKVGHHASENASPASLIREHLGRNNKRGGVVHAMISMTPFSRWKHIPHKPILDELKAKQFPFVVSDILRDKDGFVRKDDLWFEFSFDR